MPIDLNADVGESFGVYRLGDDEALMRSVSSVSIACGFHAGDPAVMRRTVCLARAAGVAVGAHPGLPDLAGFGRRPWPVTGSEVEELVWYQVGALSAIARAEGVRLRHVKAHGALYNRAVADPTIARALAGAVAALDPSLVLFALAGSCLIAEGRRAGLNVAAEAFADRHYLGDGSLVDRARPEAVLTDASEVTARGLRLAREGRVVSLDGTDLDLRPDTLCLHGDTPAAASLAQALRQSLDAAGVQVRPPA